MRASFKMTCFLTAALALGGTLFAACGEEEKPKDNDDGSGGSGAAAAGGAGGSNTDGGTTGGGGAGGTGPSCGDNKCNGSEDCSSCPDDCGPCCAHDMCETGGPLDPTCNECVQLLCETQGLEYCCTDTWDEQCVYYTNHPDFACAEPCCGNGACGVAESCVSCADCGTCQCGDGTCTIGSAYGAPWAAGPDEKNSKPESCKTSANATGCSQDCGSCCGHHVCQVGAALSPSAGCDPCIETVCNAMPECCGGDVDGGAPDPDASPPPSGWHQGCVDAAKSLCGKACTCGATLCAASQNPMQFDCDPCVTKICTGDGNPEQADPYCCTAQWDALCVENVTVFCKVECN